MLKRSVLLVAVVSSFASVSALQAQPPNRAAQPPNRPPRASLGIMVEAIPPGATTSGIVVREVPPDSPAAKAGVKAGDVIVKVGDKSINDFDALANTLAQHKPGDKLSLTVKRDGQDKTLNVTLGERQARPPVGPGGGRRRATAFLGVQTQPLTPDLKNRLGVTADQGVLVTEVVPDTPAAKAGLKQEDVIITFNGKAIANPEQLREAVQQAGAGKKATIGVVRGKEKKDLTAQLEEAPGDVSFELPRGNFPPVPEGFFGERQKVEQLERQVQQLEKRIKDLEQKQTRSSK
jgi:S1-C subfamily serine protease